MDNDSRDADALAYLASSGALSCSSVDRSVQLLGDQQRRRRQARGSNCCFSTTTSK
jgi:hypothetical protein